MVTLEVCALAYRDLQGFYMLSALNTKIKSFFTSFRYSRKALSLAWSTSRLLTLILIVTTLIAGVLPAATAYVGQLIVDSVLEAIQSYKSDGTPFDYMPVLQWVLLEAFIVALIAAAQRVFSVCRTLLRQTMGQKVNLMILEKAQSLSLSQFEDSEIYDKLKIARRSASSRPISMVINTFNLIKNNISLISYSILLINFSYWALIILFIGAIPAFIAQTSYTKSFFEIFRKRSPEQRQQDYLETLIAREDNVKEVKLFQLEERFLNRYHEIFKLLYRESSQLTKKSNSWGFILDLVSSSAFYAAYAWVVMATIQGKISLGEMTMYLLLFKQGQTAISSSLQLINNMFEDNLYLSTLYEYLNVPTQAENGKAHHGTQAGDGIRLEGVYFTYPDQTDAALKNINLHIKPGSSLAIVGENGSGKTTLIKLLTRLYPVDSGKILLDGLDIREWDVTVLRKRIGVIFQDFVRYQLLVGENVGAGDVEQIENDKLWIEAARLGMADEFINKLDKGYQTQLGRWFKGGQELSGGQWQKIALSRAFMRKQADILVLDEPTAAMDPQAEANIFEHFQEHTKNKIVILISHRFSTVRKASQIIVIEHGKLIEQGSHEELLELNGRYSHLFNLQAEGYR